MTFKKMFQNYYENSLIYKSKGTCDYEKSKINRLLCLLAQMGVQSSSLKDYCIKKEYLLVIRIGYSYMHTIGYSYISIYTFTYNLYDSAVM